MQLKQCLKGNVYLQILTEKKSNPKSMIEELEQSKPKVNKGKE